VKFTYAFPAIYLYTGPRRKVFFKESCAVGLEETTLPV